MTLPTLGNYVLGYLRDPKPREEYRLFPKLTPAQVAALPASYSIPDLTPVENQGQLGDCVANAGDNAFKIRAANEGYAWFNGARLPLYQCCLVADGQPAPPNQDTGTSLSTCAHILETDGLAPEIDYPYNTAEFGQSIPQTVLSAAKTHELLQATKLDAADEQDTINNMKAAIYQNFPVMWGMDVWESIMNVGSTGQVPMPDGSSPIGGHALCGLGWSDSFGNLDGSQGAFLFKNSWGPWGKAYGISSAGYGELPYNYILDTGAGFGDVWSLINMSGFGPAPSPPPNPTPPVAPANFTWGINQLVGTQLTLVGSTYDAKGDLLANAQINIDRSSARGTTKNWTRMGSPISNAGGAWRLTMPVASGPNFLWLVTSDGKVGYWSNDMIYL